MNSSGSLQVEKSGENNIIVSKSPLGYSLTVQNHVFRQFRWVAHFFSEGNAARAQMEQIKQEKNKKQAKHQGVTHAKR
jgi:hypothetical protein